LRACATLHRESAQRLLEKETFVEEDLAPIQAVVRRRFLNAEETPAP
jgi:cell division protease FtsH